jgi:hypothetical protein
MFAEATKILRLFMKTVRWRGRAAPPIAHGCGRISLCQIGRRRNISGLALIMLTSFELIAFLTWGAEPLENGAA